MVNCSVLLVEHDWRIRHLVRANLEAAGMTVWLAVDGSHALQVLKETWPDLVLADLDVPDLEIEALLAGMQDRERGAPLPLVLMGHDALPGRLRAIEPAALFLEKPFSAAELVERVRQALDCPRFAL